VEKTAKQGEMLPVSTSQLFAVLQSRISIQDEKIKGLIEIVKFQNKAIKSSKAIESALMENASAADICINEMLVKNSPENKADKEAA
jgi:hypothetical protein